MSPPDPLTRAEMEEDARIAGEATPGPWRAPKQDGHPHAGIVEEYGEAVETIARVYCGGYTGHGAQNATHMARFSPSRIQRYLAHIEGLEREIERLRAKLGQGE